MVPASSASCCGCLVLLQTCGAHSSSLWFSSSLCLCSHADGNHTRVLQENRDPLSQEFSCLVQTTAQVNFHTCRTKRTSSSSVNVPSVFLNFSMACVGGYLHRGRLDWTPCPALDHPGADDLLLRTSGREKRVTVWISRSYLGDDRDSIRDSASSKAQPSDDQPYKC